MDPINTSGVADSASRPSPQPAPKNNALSSDFETFLQMLTVQMQNQDPLNPLQSSDFAVQLATFSGVEQQVRTNDLLANLSAAFGAEGFSQFAGWVGLSGRSPAPTLFDGTPLDVYVPAQPEADRAELVVRDQSGRETDRRAIPAGSDMVVWDGLARSGSAFLTGRYSFSVEAFRNGEMTGELPAQTYQKIVEARLDAGEVKIAFEGGGSASATDVSALRAPSDG